MISLSCCDKDFTTETEKERKELRDKILSKHCIVNEIVNHKKILYTIFCEIMFPGLFFGC